MNKIPNIIPQNIQNYFNDLKNYLELDLYFYGSVTRDDYIPNKSDIDLCLFSDNEQSTINKLKFFLHAQQKNIKKVLMKINNDIFYGYKIKFIIDNIRCEIHIYNENFKDIIVDHLNKPLKAPFFLKIIIYILKYFYYTIPLISKETYIILKKYYMNNLIKNYNVDFFVL